MPNCDGLNVYEENVKANNDNNTSEGEKKDLDQSISFEIMDNQSVVTKQYMKSRYDSIDLSVDDKQNELQTIHQFMIDAITGSKTHKMTLPELGQNLREKFKTFNVTDFLKEGSKARFKNM